MARSCGRRGAGDGRDAVGPWALRAGHRARPRLNSRPARLGRRSCATAGAKTGSLKESRARLRARGAPAKQATTEPCSQAEGPGPGGEGAGAETTTRHAGSSLRARPRPGTKGGEPPAAESPGAGRPGRRGGRRHTEATGPSC